MLAALHDSSVMSQNFSAYGISAQTFSPRHSCARVVAGCAHGGRGCRSATARDIAEPNQTGCRPLFMCSDVPSSCSRGIAPPNPARTEKEILHETLHPCRHRNRCARCAHGRPGLRRSAALASVLPSRKYKRFESVFTRMTCDRETFAATSCALVVELLTLESVTAVISTHDMETAPR